MEMNDFVATGKQKQKIEEIQHTHIELNREERIHMEMLCAYEEFEKVIIVLLNKKTSNSSN